MCMLYTMFICVYVVGDSATAVEVTEGDIHQQLEGDVERGRGRNEEMVFRVTRHTPRHVQGVQRASHRRLLTPETSLHSAGKRMKLDETSSSIVANRGEYYNVNCCFTWRYIIIHSTYILVYIC